MFKKFVFLMVVLVMVLGIVSCGGKATPAPEPTEAPRPLNRPRPEPAGRTDESP